MTALYLGVNRRFDNLAAGIRVSADKLGWPNESLVSGQSYNGNNFYKDLRGKSWHQAMRAYRLEQDLLFRIANGRTEAEQRLLVSRVTRLERLFDGLDVCTAASVYAISAAGGIPVSSCNAGCFGGWHSEPFPLVSFWWPRSKLPILRECAKRVQVSMWPHHRGELVVGAKTIRRMSDFAGVILECQNKFA